MIKASQYRCCRCDLQCPATMTRLLDAFFVWLLPFWVCSKRPTIFSSTHVPGWVLLLLLAGPLSTTRAVPSGLHDNREEQAWVSEVDETGALEKEQQTAKEVIGKVVFKEVSHMSGATTFGHLIFRTNLSTTNDLLESADDMIEKFEKQLLSVYDNRNELVIDLLRAIAFGMFDARAEYQSIQDIFFSDEALRTKRSIDNDTSFLPLSRDERAAIVPILIAAGIGLGLGGAAGGATADHLSKMYYEGQIEKLQQQNAQQKAQFALQQAVNEAKQATRDLYIAEDLQDHEVRLGNLEEGARISNGTIVQVKAAIKGILDSGYTTKAIQMLFFTLGNVRREVSRVGKILTSLLDHKLSPLLVPTDVLRKSLDQLKLKAEREGFSTPVNQIQFLYQLSCSYQALSDGTILVGVHIPLMRKDNILTLFEHVSIPIALNKSNHIVEIRTQTQFLAVNGERTGYLELTSEQVEACSKIGTVYICKDANHLMRSFDDSCLAALFMARTEAVNKVCEIDIVPPRVVITQVSADKFLAFHARTLTFTRECKGTTTYETFRGTRELSLEAGCYGHTPEYAISSYAEYTLNTSITISNPKWKLATLTGELPIDAINRLLPDIPRKPVDVRDLKAKYAALGKRYESAGLLSGLWPFDWISTFFSTLFVLGAVALLLCCFRGRIMRMINVLLQPIGAAAEVAPFDPPAPAPPQSGARPRDPPPHDPPSYRDYKDERHEPRRLNEILEELEMLDRPTPRCLRSFDKHPLGASSLSPVLPRKPLYTPMTVETNRKGERQVYIDMQPGNDTEKMG